MIRLLAQMIVATLANALGLFAASLFFEGFSIDGPAFIVAVVIFSLSTVILGPLILKIALTNASYLVGGIALVTTLVGLILTNLISDGISINGVGTWIGATVVVWIFSTAGNLLLPLVIFKKTLEKRKED